MSIYKICPCYGSGFLRNVIFAVTVDTAVNMQVCVLGVCVGMGLPSGDASCLHFDQVALVQFRPVLAVSLVLVNFKGYSLGDGVE